MYTNKQGMQLHSLKLHTHVTSISLEPAFWDALDEIAKAHGFRRNELIRGISRGNPEQPLSSAIRLYVFSYYRHRVPPKANVDKPPARKESRAAKAG